MALKTLVCFHTLHVLVVNVSGIITFIHLQGCKGKKWNWKVCVCVCVCVCVRMFVLSACVCVCACVCVMLYCSRLPALHSTIAEPKGSGLQSPGKFVSFLHFMCADTECEWHHHLHPPAGMHGEEVELEGVCVCVCVHVCVFCVCVCVHVCVVLYCSRLPVLHSTTAELQGSGLQPPGRFVFLTLYVC